MVSRIVDAIFGQGASGQPSGLDHQAIPSSPDQDPSGLASQSTPQPSSNMSGAAYYLRRSKKNSFWVNGREYCEEQLISEGGYGYVYKVTLK